MSPELECVVHSAAAIYFLMFSKRKLQMQWLSCVKVFMWFSDMGCIDFGVRCCRVMCRFTSRLQQLSLQLCRFLEESNWQN